MLEAGKASNWSKQVDLAQKAIDAYPGWFIPYAFLGEAEGHLCMKDKARASLTDFVNDTENAPAYAKLRETADSLLGLLETDDYKKVCPAGEEK
jgi:hypothetical protein